MELGLTGKIALVTGGSHGIGRSIAQALANEGCKVVICARGRERIRETIKQIESKGGVCLGIQADVCSESGVRHVMCRIIKHWETIHILINNVGGGGRWGDEIVEKTNMKVWSEVYNKNVLTAARFTNLAIPFMRKQKWGRVVAITSIYGREAGGRPWFGAAKMGQAILMKSLSAKHYLAKAGITFNSVAPGFIMIPDTGWAQALKDNPKKTKEFIRKEVPQERFGRPDEVANLVVFVCSERASLINGASISIDGGQGRSIL